MRFLFLLQNNHVTSSLHLPPDDQWMNMLFNDLYGNFTKYSLNCSSPFTTHLSCFVSIQTFWHSLPSLPYIFLGILKIRRTNATEYHSNDVWRLKIEASWNAFWLSLKELIEAWRSTESCIWSTHIWYLKIQLCLFSVIWIRSWLNAFKWICVCMRQR